MKVGQAAGYGQGHLNHSGDLDGAMVKVIEETAVLVIVSN